jgi:hypothetical protein
MRSELSGSPIEMARAGQCEKRGDRWRLRAIAGVLAGFAVGVEPGVSHASASGGVVIVAESDVAAFGERLRAELVSMGFDVELAAGVSGGGSSPPVSIELSPIRRGTPEEGVELTVVDRQAGSTLLRAVLETSPASADSTPVLRAAELIRGSLVPIATAAAPSASTDERASAAGTEILDPEPRPAYSAPVARESPALDRRAPLPELVGGRIATIQIRGGVVASSGGLAAFPAMELGGVVWLTRSFGAELSALLPLAGMSHAETEGSSESHASALALSLRASIPFGSSAWGMDLGAGAAAIRFDTSGAASGPAYAGEESVYYGVAPFARAGVSYSLSQRWRVGAQAWAGGSLPRFRITYGERSVANWGLPLVFGSLGLEVDVP